MLETKGMDFDKIWVFKRCYQNAFWQIWVYRTYIQKLNYADLIFRIFGSYILASSVMIFAFQFLL